MNWDVIKKWFATTENAIAGTVNGQEVVKVILVAAVAGSGVWGVLTALGADVNNVITDSVLMGVVQRAILEASAKDYVALAFSVVAIVAEFYRRMKQGQKVVLPAVPVEPAKS